MFQFSLSKPGMVVNVHLQKIKQNVHGMKNKIYYFKEVAPKLGHNVVLDIRNNIWQGFTDP